MQFIVRQDNSRRKRLLLLVLAAPLMAGCSGASNMFSSDLLSKDADWFSRPGRVFIKNVSIETAPLTPDKPIDASFVKRHGPPGLVAAAVREFGRFDAALNVASLQIARLYPDGPKAR